MDKRKLIGTIIGVAMFAALIAGATFAWLTIAANTITNGTYNTVSRNFVIDYTKGSDIDSALPILTLTTASEVASSSLVSSLEVTAKLNNSSSPYGDLTLTLVTSTDEGNLISGSALRYAVSINGGTPTAPQIVTSKNQVLVLSGTNTTTQLINSTTADTIKVYLWLDGEKTIDSMMNKKYAGYIQASATQREDRPTD